MFQFQDHTVMEQLQIEGNAKAARLEEPSLSPRILPLSARLPLHVAQFLARAAQLWLRQRVLPSCMIQ